MRVLVARGTELERDFPFALVRQLFEPVLRAASLDERVALLEGAAAAAGPVVGVEVASGSDATSIEPSLSTLNALHWLTSNLAESAPLLLAVDDAHWSGAPSLRYPNFLAPRLEDLPVALAIAARPLAREADSGLGELVGDPTACVVRPRPLSLDAVSQLVRGGLTAAAHGEFCAACHRATGGNPFMLRELLVALSARGSSGAEADAAELERVAPATVQRAILLRLGRLPDAAARLAREVAVLGDDAQPRQAAALAELDAHVAGEAADALAATGILGGGRPLRFVHPLVRNAVNADLPDRQRAALHADAASCSRGRAPSPSGSRYICWRRIRRAIPSRR